MPVDVGKMNVLLAHSSVDEVRVRVRLVVGRGTALRDPGLLPNQSTASAGWFDQPHGVCLAGAKGGQDA